jgi:formate-dependent nitrite reductase membrane component NrfD
MGAKSVATGTLLLAALALAAGYDQAHELVATSAPLIALVFVAVTGLLLTIDLERPERFLRILFQPNWTSWLVRGAYLLVAFAALASLWLLLALASAEGATRVIAVLSIPVSIATAVYTAFLFWQAPGRELWQTRVIAPHLAAQAVVAGAAVWLLMAAVAGAEREVSSVLAVMMLGGLSVSALATAREFGRRGTKHLERAAALVLRGALARSFWGGAAVAGHVAPAALALAYLIADTSSALLVVAALLALGGQAAYDEVWVRAGQFVSQS